MKWYKLKLERDKGGRDKDLVVPKRVLRIMWEEL